MGINFGRRLREREKGRELWDITFIVCRFCKLGWEIKALGGEC